MDDMKELYEKVSRDITLQEKFTGILKDAKKEVENATQEKLVAFAKEAGYEVTIEEMQEFFKGLAEAKEEELSETELDQVAGGKAVGIVGVTLSIAGMGIGCAIYSIIAAVDGSDCGRALALSYGSDGNAID